MRALTLLLTLLMLFACGEKEPVRPLSEPGEKLYALRGTIVSRNASDNTLKVDHEAIPGFMEPMVMDYSVRGVKVGTLPADKTRIEARLHVTSRSYWITDVKQTP